jgi:hypothetical protein
VQWLQTAGAVAVKRQLAHKSIASQHPDDVAHADNTRGKTATLPVSLINIFLEKVKEENDLTFLSLLFLFSTVGVLSGSRSFLCL